jgi:diaminopimelate decarboxylase
VICDDNDWKGLIDELPALLSYYGTPAYVYNQKVIRQRAELLQSLLGDVFNLSYAVKSNPNAKILSFLGNLVDTLDVSSFGEVKRAVAAGIPASSMTFSGPAKRPIEIREAIRYGVGELVVESVGEASAVSSIASELDTSQSILVRINPDSKPRGFGASMSGKASQFGIDEGQLSDALPLISRLPGIELKGFHIYSATNCLSVGPLLENFSIMLAAFQAASDILEISPERLIFGAGFGVPYLPSESELDIVSFTDSFQEIRNTHPARDLLAKSRCSLELGRWIVAPAGLMLTSVIGEKVSHGTDIRLCDAGFNNHLAACGLMGSVIRRAWNIENLSSQSTEKNKYNLVGPLCTSIDLLATNAELPNTSVGDILAVKSSGAYGFTASPHQFISHPTPHELWLNEDNRIMDITESLTN